MVTDLINILMVTNMTENGRMIKNMELEHTIINNKMKNTLIMKKNL